MDKKPLSILQVNTYDYGGGAEAVAWNLFKAFQKRGLDSWFAVGRKYTDDPHVLEIPRQTPSVPWARICWLLHGRLTRLEQNMPRIGRLCAWLRIMAQGIPEIKKEFGCEDFNFTGTRQLLQMLPVQPDIVHLHNLHKNYFDLRLLPAFSRQVPLVLLLHDSWLLGGNCAHSFTCDRWMTGCGACPDITIKPGIKRDATAYNWRRKKKIYSQSRLYVATPCHWLMDKVRQSIVMAGARECRVIPNGVDRTIFHPGNKTAARESLGIGQDAKVILIVGSDIRNNMWKDYRALQEAIFLTASPVCKVTVVVLGENAPPERIGESEICFVPPQKNPLIIARYYQAADFYVHASRADTFPNTILEALACGTPVIATAVGGIPEQVKGLSLNIAPEGQNFFSQTHATGILVPMGNSEALAAAMRFLLKNDTLCRQLGEQAAQDAQERFDLERQTDDFLAWYQEIIAMNNDNPTISC